MSEAETVGQLPIPPAADDEATVTARPADSTPASRSDLPAPPGYELLGELGRGGMGVVYKARQTTLGRVVALKMILSGAHAGEADLARFRTEAQAIARLQHPNIVQIFEVGDYDGRPFFALEFCDGGSLDRKLAGTPLPPREAAQLVETLARAMYAAHQANVIHRDLKPANILLTENGSPKITDFGLAKKLDDAGQTQSGAIMGTPSYMAPEQAAGKGQEVGPGADVYALGAILYRLLTGRPPFQAATTWDTIQQVIRDDPAPPTRLQPRTPRDVESICLKCLCKRPGQRYATAADLADDLGRFSEGRPVEARPIGRAARAAKWVRRRPALAALLAVSAAAVFGTIFLLDAARRQANDRTVAEAALRRDVEGANGRLANEQVETRRQLDRTRRLLFTGQLVRAAPLAEHEPTRALALLRDQDACPTDLRDFAWGYFHRLANRDQGALTGHAGAIGVMAVSPDGRTLASAGPDDKGGCEVLLWDVQAARSRGAAFSCAGSDVAAIAFSPDGRLLAIAANGPAAVTLCPTDDPDRRRELVGPPSILTALAFTTDGALVTAAGLSVKVWAVVSGKGHAFWDGPPVEAPSSLAPSACALASFSADGQRVATAVPAHSLPKDAAPEQYPVRVFDVVAGKLLREVTDGGKLTCLALSPAGEWLALGRGEAKPASLYDLREPLSPSRPLPPMDRGVLFSSDGRTLAGSGLDLANGVSTLPVMAANPADLLRLPFGKWPTFTDALRVRVSLWDVAERRERARIAATGVPYAFTADDKGLLLVSAPPDDPRVRLHDARTGQLVFAFDHEGGDLFAPFRPQCLAVTPDSRTLAVAVSGPSYPGFPPLRIAKRPGVIHLWNISTRALYDTSAGGGFVKGLFAASHTDVVTRELLSPDGVYAVNLPPTVAGAGEKIAQTRFIVRRKQTGREEASLSPPGVSEPLAFRTDGGALAFLTTSVGEAPAPRQSLNLFDLPSGSPLGSASLPVGPHAASSCVFTPDGREAAVAFLVPKEVGLVNFETGQYSVLANKDSLTPTTAMTWSPDGKRLAFADNVKVYVWARPEPGRDSVAVRLPPGHHRVVTGLAFSPDGTTLASAAANEDWVRLWDVVIGQERAALPVPMGMTMPKNLTFSPDGRELCAFDATGRVVRWASDPPSARP